MKRQITRETVMIREARIRMGYSQQEVAALAGVHIRQYQRLEYGEREIHRINMQFGMTVCAILGLDPFLLIFGRDFHLPSE